MENKLKIVLEIDPDYNDPLVTIKTAKNDVLIERIIESLEKCVSSDVRQIAALKDDSVVFLNQEDIIRVYIENRRLKIRTASEIYESKLTLRDIEDLLSTTLFSRISRFEIVNLRKIKEFDLSIAGTIKVTFEDRSETWVARRYVKTIQEKLIKGGHKDEQ